MNEQERYAAFVAAVENAMAKYGYQIAAQVQVEVQGAIVLSRGIAKVEPIPNWQPKAEPEQQSAPTANPETEPAPNENGSRAKSKEKI